MADEQTALVPQSTRMPEVATKRGITEAQWLTLRNSLFPGAKDVSVILVWDYCKARGLDALKKPCHIVPMEVKIDGQYVWRDVVMPGIYEYRTTAHRTKQYLGHSEPEYGEEIDHLGVKAPKWCGMTFFRWNAEAKERVPFPVKVFFSEVVALKSGKPNSRWTRAPIQMLTKCTEAAGLREAFPEEFGGEMTAEEMDGQRAIDITPPKVAEVTINLLDKLPESLRDNVERALSALHQTLGQRQAIINEYLGAEGVVPEEGAEKLLKWAEGQLTAQPKPKPDNGRKKKPTEPEPEPTITADEIPF